MVSNDKHREIAANLRKSREFIDGLSSVSLEQKAFDTFECILRCVCYEHGNIFDYLADLIDRPTCHNVYNEMEMGSCTNGFECSVCGNRVEDLEHCCITGTFNCCPKCQREVVPDER